MASDPTLKAGSNSASKAHAITTAIVLLLVGVGVSLIGGEKSTADEQPPIKNKPADKKTQVGFREAAVEQAKSLVATLKEKTRRLNDFRKNGLVVNQASSSLVALAQAIVKSKDPVFVNDIPRFERIAANSSVITKYARKRAQADWVVVKGMVSELESLMAAKHQDIERTNQGAEHDINQAVREGTMKQFEAWFRSSKDIKDIASMKLHATKAEHSARVVDLLAQSISEWQDAEDDPDFEKHANELQQSFARVGKAVHQQDLASFRLALSAATKKCSECHSEYRN